MLTGGMTLYICSCQCHQYMYGDLVNAQGLDHTFPSAPLAAGPCLLCPVLTTASEA